MNLGRHHFLSGSPEFRLLPPFHREQVCVGHGVSAQKQRVPVMGAATNNMISLGGYYIQHMLHI